MTGAARLALRRRGLAEARVITDWPDIVGRAIAAGSCPERLVRGRGEAEGGVLRVRVAGGLALELQHLEPIVIERLNTYFGYRAVERLQIVQGPLPERPAPRRPAPPPIDPAREAALEAELAGVGDAELRLALAGLGRAVETDRGESDVGGRRRS